jgi:Leucine-rich repeat (LRR) protein
MLVLASLPLGATTALAEARRPSTGALTFVEYCENGPRIPASQRPVAELMVSRVRAEAEAAGSAGLDCAALAVAAATMFRLDEGMVFLDVSLSGEPSSYDLTPLASLPALEDLVLVLAGISAANMEVLARFTQLKQLHLVCAAPELEPCPWERSELVGRLSGLEMLLVSGMRLESSRALASLGNLKKLSLEKTTLRDLAGIGLLVGLRDLSVEASAVVDVTDLMALINLRTLTLSGNPQIQDVMAVRYMANLEQLYLDDCGVHDLAPLSGLAWLYTLHVSAQSLQSGGSAAPRVETLAPLKDLKHLHSLKIAEQRLGDAGLAAMGEQKALRELDLTGNPLTDLAPIAASPELRILKLAKLPGVTTYAPLGALPRLGHLDLTASRLEAVPPSLEGAQSLKGLDLSENPLSLPSVATLGGLPRLRELFLRGVGATDLAALPKLERLSLIDVSGNALTSLAPLAGWKSLTNVIAREVPEAARTCPAPSLSCTF